MCNSRYVYREPTSYRMRDLRTLEGIPERYLTVEWLELRDRVILEANFRCQHCGGTAQTAHHTTYTHGLICHPRYLVALCWDCHHKEHPEIFQDYL
jgi:5-methylcytosine-specific restriction endonuclease McrA